MIKVSAALSIHNRSGLFRRALDGYMKQTLPPEEWEIVLVDDLSTEDLSLTYRHLIGKINLLHVYMDHTRHPIFKAANPGWKPGQPKKWFHTPAISTNLAASLADGSTICLCHPEILHAPTNFEKAYEILQREKLFIFGRTYIGTPVLNVSLFDVHAAGGSWTDDPWLKFISEVAEEPFSSAVLDEGQLYWYTSFLPKEAVAAVRGVDFAYLGGVAAEDDDFRVRVYGAGWEPVHKREIVGVHQYHEDETEKHRRRESPEWQAGLATNRAIYAERQKNGFPKSVNPGLWSGRETVVKMVQYSVGSDKPLVTVEA